MNSHIKNNNFSIIIPTCNRPERLNRILNYYNEYGKDFNIIVADSSSKEIKKQNKKNISLLSDINIAYLDKYAPEKGDFSKCMNKIIDAIDASKGKYCVKCDDDDFVTVTGIKNAINFLEKNPDYSAALGRFIGFWVKKDDRDNKKFYWLNAYEGHKKYYWGKVPFMTDSVEFEDAESRLLSYLSTYPHAIPAGLGVYRKEIFKLYWTEANNHTDDGRFSEVLSNMITVIYGKMKRLDGLFGAREYIPKSLGTSQDRYNDFVISGTYDEKYYKFANCLATHLVSNSQLNLKEAKKVIDKGWSNYTRKYMGFLIPKITRMLNNAHLSTKVDEVIRTAYKKIKNRKNTQTRSEIVSAYDIHEPPKEFQNEFNEIKKYVLK